ncbi:120_t:CDS:2 [Dentiscutata heterogama]|uniref:120_t:CDS:1 n=1 Tax=Dentiscutata heterogama TaxID=1316150 RepID=A0ACA9LFN1_9GLOM|nr:120_t:CDS:2 [Dentiscutata heterogama]
MSQPSEYNKTYDNNSFTGTNSEPDKIKETINESSQKRSTKKMQESCDVEIDNKNLQLEKQIEKVLVTWIIDDYQLFFVLQSLSFICLIKVLDSYYVLPSDKQIKHRITEVYNLVFAWLKEVLENEAMLKKSATDINANKEFYLHAIANIVTRWNSSYIAWTRLIQLHESINIIPKCESNNVKTVDLDNLNTIFKEVKDFTIYYDEISETKTMNKEHKIKVSDPTDCDELVKKVKYSLHRALNFYWKSLTEILLVTILLDPVAKNGKAFKIGA